MASGGHSGDQCDLSVLNLDVQSAAGLGHGQPQPVGLDPLARQSFGQAFARQTRRRLGLQPGARSFREPFQIDKPSSTRDWITAEPPIGKAPTVR